MHYIESFLERGSVVYVFTRLYDYVEKIKAEQVEAAVMRAMTRAAHDNALVIPSDAMTTFVPFRDTAQFTMSTPEQIHSIYVQDIARVNQSGLLVGFLDGLSKDEGVCLEIGYAYGRGIPVIVVSTDFIWYRMKADTSQEFIFDPLIDLACAKIVRQYTIPLTPPTFIERLNLALTQVYEQLEAAAYDLFSTEPPTAKPLPSGEPTDVYLEFGGGFFEWERQITAQLANSLEAEGITCRHSTRFDDNPTDKRPLASRAQDDLQALLSAKVVVVSADSFEMNPGSAMLHGLARAKDKRLILYDSKTADMVSDGPYRFSRNLMIEQAADVIVNRIDQILPQIVRFLAD